MAFPGPHGTRAGVSALQAPAGRHRVGVTVARASSTAHRARWSWMRHAVVGALSALPQQLSRPGRAARRGSCPGPRASVRCRRLGTRRARCRSDSLVAGGTTVVVGYPGEWHTASTLLPSGHGRTLRSSWGGTPATAEESCSTTAPFDTAASKKARTAFRSGATNAIWDSRKPSPLVCGPIQNIGLGGRPNPTARQTPSLACHQGVRGRGRRSRHWRPRRHTGWTGGRASPSSHFRGVPVRRPPMGTIWHLSVFCPQMEACTPTRLRIGH